MDNCAVVGEEWQYVLQMMPEDLEESAVAKFALRRRRQIASAGDLLRLALAYGLCDFSLRQTAAWASLIGLGELSSVAVMKRLRGSSQWLAHLVVRWLQERGLPTQVPAFAVRIIDATAISQPGSRGTDWRVHMGLDLAEQRITTIDLTQVDGGETFLRHRVAEGHVLLADRAYARRPGIAHVLDQQAHVVVRFNWQNLPLQSSQGHPLDLVALLETLNPGEVADWPVGFCHDDRTYPMRLIALRKSAAAGEAEALRLRRRAKRKGHRPDPRNLRAGHFVYLLTDLPADRLPTREALELYRLRWQIELAFKRMKSILHIDHLRAKDNRLASTYLYANILGALIVDELCRRALTFSPWGYPLPTIQTQPLAPAVPTLRQLAAGHQRNHQPAPPDDRTD